ncbi:PREDICTED: uncharacterized protein LOC105154225 [Acromyrmex echinatior]|uniref:uncharacterized protein LOC105154225 n=1 Tax=Acromyrmex echinatior TaxID=103372 RepID=UPI000580F02C|nr:PREDICTED: uncharacterized protein LOC105154225 [Acromyrmex echinatior]
MNDNAIDYVHWDDLNELVDCLQLLDTSHRTGNNAHDNEMSIIEELCEADYYKLNRVSMKRFSRADIVEMRPYSGFNRGHHYIFTVIDVFSKYAWAIPFKSKSGSKTADAIAEIVRKSRKSIILAIKWVDELPRLVSDYIARKHRHATRRRNSRDRHKILGHSAIKIAGSAKFKVGDSIRVSKYKTIFEKFGYAKLDHRGLSRKIVAVAFYELHRATHPDVYLMEKVLRRKEDKVYIKWLEFDGSHNSWIHKNNVM